MDTRKRSRGFKQTKSGRPKKKQRVSGSRAGYGTVARSRGWAAKGEMKYFDSVREVVAIAASATWAGTVLDPNVSPVANMNCLFCPTQGAGVNQRIGKACKLYKIKLNGLIVSPAQLNQAASDSPCYIRVMLVMDRQTNATQMTGTQLMTSPGVASAALAPLTHQNIDNFGRFRVLKDKTIILQNPTISYDGTNIEQSGLMRKFKMNVKFRFPVEVRFNATNGGTVADIVDNSFHFLAIVSNLDLNPYVSYSARCCFKE